MDVSIVEGVCVDRDTVGVAQGRVIHHVDPGVNGRNGTIVSDVVVEVLTNVLNLLHDVRRSIIDFVSDGQAVDIARTICFYGVDERSNIVVDLNEIGKTLSSSSSRTRILLGELGLTLEAELAIVPPGFLPSVTEAL